MYTVQDIYASDQNTYELPALTSARMSGSSARSLHNFTGNPGTAALNGTFGDWWVG